MKPPPSFIQQHGKLLAELAGRTAKNSEHIDLPLTQDGVKLTALRYLTSLDFEQVETDQRIMRTRGILNDEQAHTLRNSVPLDMQTTLKLRIKDGPLPGLHIAEMSTKAFQAEAGKIISGNDDLLKGLTRYEGPYR